MTEYSKIYRSGQQLVKLAIPLAIAQLAQALTGLVDTLMMGRLGTSILAAGGLASITFMTLISVVGAIVMAVTPLIAEADGAGNRQQVARITGQGFWLVGISFMPLALLVANLDRWLIIFGQNATTVIIADTYLDIMVWGCFPALGFMLLRGVTSGLSHPRPIMSIVFGGTLFNIVANYILAFGRLGFPQLGIAGLAIASVLSWWGMFGALLLYLLRHPQFRDYGIFTKIQIFVPKTFNKLLELGVPMGLFIALESGLFAVVSYLMGALDTDTLAAHQIVLQTVVIIFMVPLGISYATTIEVGQAWGKQNIARIRQAAYLSIVIGLLFNLALAIAICIFPRSVIGLYLDLNEPDNLAVINLAIPMLRIGAIALILDGMQKIVYGALQGLQDSKAPVFLSIPAFWLVGLTLGYVLGFNYGLGGVGLWLGQSIGLAIASVLFLIRWLYLVSRLSDSSSHS
ncbi:MAG: MATE family efflux transporter [Cyanobacteria bacterium J06623_7]